MLYINDFSNRFQQLSGMPLSNEETKAKLKRAGIDTNSKQYQAAISSMAEAARGGVAYTSVAAIKNVMRRFDKDGDHLNSWGIAGMDITGKNPSEWHKIIHVSERSRQEMFDEVKRQFLQENGVHNGYTTRRSEVFARYQKSVPKEQRLKGTWTLGEYERQYHLALCDAAKRKNPNWEPGMPVEWDALDGITRETVEATLAKTDSELVRKEFNVRI